MKIIIMLVAGVTSIIYIIGTVADLGGANLKDWFDKNKIENSIKFFKNNEFFLGIKEFFTFSRSWVMDSI